MPPQDPRVLDAMLPYQVNYYGNPHSRTHAYGWESESGMEKARKVIYQCDKSYTFSISNEGSEMTSKILKIFLLYIVRVVL